MTDGSPGAAPLDAALGLIADRLGVPAAVLFATDPVGGLRPVATVGSGDAAALGRHVAGGAAVDGARFAATAELGTGEGVLAVFGPEDPGRDDAWSEAFAASATLALGLLRGETGGSDRARLLHEVAAHPGTLDVRLGVALERAAAALGMDAAAFAHADGETWTPDLAYDPTGRLVPPGPVPLDGTFCSATVLADGAVGVADAAASGLDVAAPAAYLGAPVFVDGRCVGTFSVVAGRPRGPFPDEDRRLVESLARWVGSALTSRGTARRLADREATLGAFFDGAPMGMGVVRLVPGPDGADDLEVVAVNAAGAAAFGAAPDDLAGRLVSETGVSEAEGHLWVGVCHRARDGAATSRFESVRPGPDGPRTYTTTVACAEAGGAAAGAFAFVIEDVTDLRDAVGRLRAREAQLDAIVAEAPVALFTADGRGRLASARGRDVAALGLDPARALGRRLADLFEHVPDAADALRDAFAGAEATWEAGADDRTFECRLRPTYGAPGQITGLLGVAVDVTDRERAETAAARARRAADTLARGRSALITHVDRRVRSPLTAILGYADLLDDDPSAEDVAEVRAVIGRAGDRLLEALDDLRDLALLDGAPLHPRPTPTDLPALVAAVAEEARPAAEAARVALNVWCSLPDGLLLLDADVAERVVRSLVGGAVAAPAGVRVDVRLVADGADWVSLRVAGGAARHPAGAVTAGPDLVHRLVEALGGTARETDEPGWAVRLPRRPAPPAGDGAAPAWTPVPFGAAATPGPA